MSSSFTILISKDICMQNIFYLQALIGEVINYSSKINSIYIEKNTILPLLSQYKITSIILTNIHVLYKLFPRNVHVQIFTEYNSRPTSKAHNHTILYFLRKQFSKFVKLPFTRFNQSSLHGRQLSY